MASLKHYVLEVRRKLKQKKKKILVKNKIAYIIA